MSPWLDPMIAEIKAHGSLAYRITLKGAMHLEASAFVPDTYRIHIPVPAHSAQAARYSHRRAGGGACARGRGGSLCPFWEKKLDAWEDIPLSYTYISEIRYADPLNAPKPLAPLYPNARPVEPPIWRRMRRICASRLI